MKKIISILLVVCMLFSMLTTVMAEQTAADKLDAFEYKDISISDAYNSKMYADYDEGTINLNGKNHKLKDTYFPTIDKNNPYKLK